MGAAGPAARRAEGEYLAYLTTSNEADGLAPPVLAMGDFVHGLLANGGARSRYLRRRISRTVSRSKRTSEAHTRGLKCSRTRLPAPLR
jgi:hypothetical protein